MITISTYQAKAELSGILDKVASGEVVTITRNGEAVAVMHRPETATSTNVIAQILQNRHGQCLRNDTTIEELVQTGRRF